MEPLTSLPGQNPIDHDPVPRPARASRNVFRIQPRRDAVKAQAFRAEYLHAVQCRGFTFIEPERLATFATSFLYPHPHPSAAEFQHDLALDVLRNRAYELAHENPGGIVRHQVRLGHAHNR